MSRSRRLFIVVVLILLAVAPASAAPILVEFGAGLVLNGVSPGADGATNLVGYRTDPNTGARVGVIVTVAADGSSYDVRDLGGLPGDTSWYANAIRGDYIVGNRASSNTQGIAWNVNAPGTAIPVQSINLPGVGDSTVLFDVNSSGQFAGGSASGAFAVIGQIGGATTALPNFGPDDAAHAAGISENGILVGSIDAVAQDAILPTVWLGHDIITLPTPAGALNISFLEDISERGTWIGGSFDIFDPLSETTGPQAAVWSGAAWQDVTALYLADGVPVLGEVLGVTDNGFAVGYSQSGGFIWREGWQFAQIFNDWVLSEFGVSFPSWITSVIDVFFDGGDLLFALQGSAYFFRTPVVNDPSVPEPASLLTLGLALPLLGLSSRRRTAKGRGSD